MAEKDFNKIFSKRLKYYLHEYDLSQTEFAKRMGVGPTSVYNWLNGIKTPRMDKVDAMCEMFHCTRADLITDPDDIEEKPQAERIYYLNTETAETAQAIFENKELRALFDVQKDMDSEDLQALYNMALALKRKERKDDDAGC